MNVAACLMILLVVTCASGCRTSPGPAALREGLKQLEFSRRSVVQYAEAPRGTQFVPRGGMSVTNVIQFQRDGYVVFIDEQPKYDWAHNCQLAFIPITLEKPDVIFRGVGRPDFALKAPDGSTVTKWEKY